MTTRRDFLQSAALGAMALGAATVLPAVDQALASDAATKAKSPTPTGKVVETTSECIRAGEVCVAHCTRELATGNKDMANCNARVHEMLAMVKTMLTLAASDSKLAPRVAAICADACKACADACAEHKEHWGHGMHLECKACHDACLTCEEACRALV